MEYLNYLLTFLHIDVDFTSKDTSPFLLLLIIIFLLSLISMFCVLNILIYISVIYIGNRPDLLNKLPKH